MSHVHGIIQPKLSNIYNLPFSSTFHVATKRYVNLFWLNRTDIDINWSPSEFEYQIDMEQFDFEYE